LAHNLHCIARRRTRLKSAPVALSSEKLAAIGIDGNGDKHPLALVESATENTATVQALLDSLVERGLDPAVARFFIVDGAKALLPFLRAALIAQQERLTKSTVAPASRAANVQSGKAARLKFNNGRDIPLPWSFWIAPCMICSS